MPVRVRSEDETRFYPVVKQALADFFEQHGYVADFEVTAWGVPAKFLFKNNALLGYRAWLPRPDVMGKVQKRGIPDVSLVVAEFKLTPKFEDIFKTKGYDELFRADYSFLVGRASYSESYSTGSGMAYLEQDPDLLKTKCCTSEVRVVTIRESAVDGSVNLVVKGNEKVLWDGVFLD